MHTKDAFDKSETEIERLAIEMQSCPRSCLRHGHRRTTFVSFFLALFVNHNTRRSSRQQPGRHRQSRLPHPAANAETLHTRHQRPVIRHTEYAITLLNGSRFRTSADVVQHAYVSVVGHPLFRQCHSMVIVGYQVV